MFITECNSYNISLLELYLSPPYLRLSVWSQLEYNSACIQSTTAVHPRVSISYVTSSLVLTYWHHWPMLLQSNTFHMDIWILILDISNLDYKGRRGQRSKSFTTMITMLHCACLKLLTVSLVVADFDPAFIRSYELNDMRQQQQKAIKIQSLFEIIQIAEPVLLQLIFLFKKPERE